MEKVTEKIKELINKFDKKTYIIMGIVVIVIIVITSLLLLSSNSKKKDLELLELIFDADKPLVYEDGGKYGYMTRDGEVLIEATYESAEPFYGDYALVLSKEDNTTEYRIIDKEAQIILTSKSASKPRYFREYGVWLIDNKIYSGKMKEIFRQNFHITYSSLGYFIYQDNNSQTSGIIDYRGEKVYSWNEDYISLDISPINYPEADAYGAISNYEEREAILSLKSGRIIYTLEDPKNTYIEVEPDNIFRIIDRENNYKTSTWLYLNDDRVAFASEDEIYDITIDNYMKNILKIDYGVNYERLGHEERYVYYDTKAKEYLDSSYGKEESTTKNDWMESVYGYKTYTCSGLYGLMDKSEVLVDCTHTNIAFLNDDLYEYLRQYHDKPLALIQKDSTYDIYNLKEKKKMVTYDLASVRFENESSFLLVTEYEEDGFTKKDYVVRNLITDAEETFESNAKIALYSNYITVSLEDTTLYYDVDLHKIYETRK